MKILLAVGLACGPVALLLAACGGGSADAPDAGPDAATTIAMPAPPAPPVLTPCAPGWREVPPVDPDDVATCDPWPVTGEASCALDEAHFPGEPGCTRVGSACPAGEWPEGLPAGQPILYVRAGGAAGGDGTLASPFGTIAAAMAAAAAGTVVALGKGTFDEAVTIGAGVTLWGACVAMTRVASSSLDGFAGTITVTAGGAQVRNLSVGGDRPGVWVTSAAASLHIEDVIVADAQFLGIYVAGQAHVTGHTVVVRDTRRSPAGTFGRGLNVSGASQVDVSRVAVERNHNVGVFVSAAGTTLTLTGVVVRDTQGRSDGTTGTGLLAQASGELIVSGAAVERNRSYGLTASGTGTTVTVADAVVRDTSGEELGQAFGRGIFLDLAARMDVTRALVARNREAGLSAATEATLTLADVVVCETLAAVDGTAGRGIEVHLAGHVEGARVLLARNRDVGLHATDPGTTVDLTDLVVRDTLPQDVDQVEGRGLNVQLGARATVSRAIVERNRDVGVLVNGPSTLVLDDLVVRDTRSRASDERFGRGLAAQDGAQLTARRVVLLENLDLGLSAWDPGTVVDLEDAVIVATRDQECEASGTCGWDFTSGAGSYLGASLRLERFAVSGSALCGLQLAREGTMDLADGEVSGNPIGANVQTVDFDLTRLQTRVIFRDNDVNLDGSGQPLPEPSP